MRGGVVVVWGAAPGSILRTAAPTLVWPAGCAGASVSLWGLRAGTVHFSLFQGPAVNLAPGEGQPGCVCRTSSLALPEGAGTPRAASEAPRRCHSAPCCDLQRAGMGDGQQGLLSWSAVGRAYWGAKLGGSHSASCYSYCTCCFLAGMNKVHKWVTPRGN